MNAFLIVILAIVAATASAQRNYGDSKNAAILAEARYLQGDGSFGSAYTQDDGTEFKEETGDGGERRGQYSYVDPTGKKITVMYTAGKNGFQVSGDHLPRAPIPQTPAPQYNSAPQQQQQRAALVQQQQNNNNGIEDGQYRPEVHETPYAYNQNDNNQYDNNQYNSAPAPAPVQSQGFNYAAPQQQQQQQQQQYYQTTTPQPNRFFPPGKVDLNRTPDGFQYQFSSNGRQ